MQTHVPSCVQDDTVLHYDRRATLAAPNLRTTTVAPPVKVYTYTYSDLERLTHLTKTGVSQAVCRGILEPNDLLSVCAFLVRYGSPDVRLHLMERMLGLDRQETERNRPQSTVGIGRDHDGKLETLTDAERQKKRGKKQ